MLIIKKIINQGHAVFGYSNFYEAIILGFRNFFNYTGRASRAEFWWWHLFTVLMFVLFANVTNIIGILIGYDRPFSAVILPLIFAILLSWLFIRIRRLHDIDLSGLWLLIGIIPLIGLLLQIYWYCKKGDVLSNHFGSPSKIGNPVLFDKFLWTFIICCVIAVYLRKLLE
ncbi:DUF805 domain-containing protein [Candidatus Tisiphia endosymbiont of Nedyus quadrimaculatus]|uniref:DUF805 domain-containing protein n=1 Tax=Candidatus Tisiphia endosymbiont of Nedyus quadrimaculatus TaxID=3139332 RepID=UPI00345F0597